jgi:hypothetical protein
VTTPTPPTITLPGAYSIPSIAPVYVDSIPIGPLTPPPVPITPVTSRQQNSQDFWSSDLRPAADPGTEQLVVSLGQRRPVNYITLDLAHFPHLATFWFWDGEAWSQAARRNGAPLEILTTGSVPAVVDNPAALAAGLNPYHYGAGHWVHNDEDLTSVTTSRVMVRLKRLSQGTGSEKFPVNPHGKHVPYPLGVRNLDLGLRLVDCDDAPQMLRDPEVLSLRQPFATSTDVKGSPIQVAIRENRASDLLRGQ